MNVAQETGSRIRYYRKAREMTLDQLAQMVCKSRSCVSKYENGQIAVDLPTLYDIAEALGVRVTQLLALPPARRAAGAPGQVPAFFAGLDRFYIYAYDGRSRIMLRCVVDVLEQISSRAFRVQMYMNVDSFERYQLCESVYEGTLSHFDALSLLSLQNPHMRMDHYQVGIPRPYLDGPVKWGLTFGVFSRVLMPTASKVLLAKAPQEETAEFIKGLRLTKEDIRLLKQYNMLTIV